MTHNQIEGTPIGQHPMVMRLLKSIHNSRLPQPRYSETWDVDVVIKHICSIGDNKELSLKTLSQAGGLNGIGGCKSYIRACSSRYQI